MTTFASVLFESEAQVAAVRDLLQQQLRAGFAEDAAAQLELAVDALHELGHPIAPLCRSATVDSLTVYGWELFPERLARNYRADQPICAIGIDLSWPGHVGLEPDDHGRLDPYIETNLYADSPFAFSAANRAQIIAGYEQPGPAWQGSFVHIDDETVSVGGMEYLFGAAFALDRKCRTATAEEPASALDQDAMFVAMAFVAVRVHQAIREKVLSAGLPRALTVLVGSNESYPFFDAPVITADEYRQVAPQQHTAAAEAKPSAYSAVASYQPATDGQTAPELSSETADPQPIPAPQQSAEVISFPENAAPAASGASLRRNLMQKAAESGEPYIEEPVQKQAGLLGKLFGRR